MYVWFYATMSFFFSFVMSLSKNTTRSTPTILLLQHDLPIVNRISVVGNLQRCRFSIFSLVLYRARAKNTYRTIMVNVPSKSIFITVISKLTVIDDCIWNFHRTGLFIDETTCHKHRLIYDLISENSATRKHRNTPPKRTSHIAQNQYVSRFASRIENLKTVFRQIVSRTN